MKLRAQTRDETASIVEGENEFRLERDGLDTVVYDTLATALDYFSTVAGFSFYVYGSQFDQQEMFGLIDQRNGQA